MSVRKRCRPANSVNVTEFLVRLGDTLVVIGLVLLCIVGCSLDIASRSISPAAAEADHG